ncbi:hypothetical protein Trydic_g6060 [Trypoxylus dichotomus]
MSLFPAYAEANKNENEKPKEDDSWLSLSSFKTVVPTVEINKPTTQTIGTGEPPLQKDNEVSRKRKKKQKHQNKEVTQEISEKRKKKQRHQNEEVILGTSTQDTEGCFEIDKSGVKKYLSVPTISRPAVAKYHTFNSRYKVRKPKKFKRYYCVNYDTADDKNGSDNEEKIMRKDLEKKVPKVEDENFTGFKQEAEMSQTTASYNRSLAEDPTNVDMWLKYTRFQDAVYQFEKTYRKGSIAKGLRVTAERKLAILDKALTHLPNNECLLRERLNVCVNVYPADELYEQLKRLVEKEQGNIIFWQGLIESRQCSMSHCNTPAVIDLYVKCLSTLHQLRRSAKLEKVVLEESILRMLYQCGLFLKQSGLFEHLWTLLRLYLELNISQDKNKFNLLSGFEEKRLLELEEIVLQSQLPLHELWLRIEKLRESCHWLPFTGDGECEDPQRVVFPTDVAELIHPIAVPENIFKLTATILTLLKIPLLPCRHTTMKNLGLDYVPWALDSIEIVLPIFLNLYPIDVTNKLFINYSQKLTVGPQYLKPLPGQEHFLMFILQIIKNCIDSLNGNEKTAISVWWFRFQRMLYVLESQGLVKMPKSLKKQMKTEIKSLLKEEANNIVLYKEYALLENDLGNVDNSVNILKTAVGMYNNRFIDSIEEVDTKSSLCSVYRTLIEFHLNPSSKLYDKQKALNFLLTLSLGKTIEGDSVDEDLLNEAALKFKHITLLVLQREFQPRITVQHFLPHFMIDWIICYGWLLYLTKGVIECGVFIEDTLKKLDEKCAENIWEKEVLYEFYAAVLFKNCLENSGAGMFKILDDVLKRGIEQYPNNIFMLSVLAKEHTINCCLGQSFWKVKSILMKTGHALPNLFLVLIANQKVMDIQENWIVTVTGERMTDDTGLKNRMLSLFQNLISTDMCTRRCGLIWRLYLQFLHENFDPITCKNAYYSAVEACPWLKALYIDAAIYIPADLPQIQDLLIEKQLRLHITPEELDIMRN